MTTEELAEIFLAHLYELAEAAPHPNFLFSVNDFAPKLGLNDRQELQKALNYLGDRGFVILASFDVFGGISAGITIEGSSFVEQGGETGAIKKYLKPPRKHVEIPPAEEGAASLSSVNRSIEAILEDIRCVLEADLTLSAQSKEDLLSDLATLKIQMGRSVKSKELMGILTQNLSRIPSISPLVTALSGILKEYLG